MDRSAARQASLVSRPRATHLSRVSAIHGEHALAVQYATEIIEREPFQETGYRHLMQMHAEMGNRGEALRVFGKCRELFRDGSAPIRQRRPSEFFWKF